MLLDAALSRRVEAGEVDAASLGAREWLRLRMAGHINKLAHLVRWDAAPGRLQRRFRWKGIRSANFGAWMRDLRAVNGFDESFSGWGHEDADLVLRLHHAGVMRKNGYLATEVFHLWHAEQARDREAHNRRGVEDRIRSGTVRADVGLAEAAAGPAPTVTELNR